MHKHWFIERRRNDITTLKVFSQIQILEPVYPRTLESFRVSCTENRGFTLIEILVVIVIAGILLPAIVVPFASGIKGSGKPEKATTAMYLAHQKMEEFMKFDYSNTALNTTALTPYANAGIPNYQWQWEIVYVDSNFNSSGTDGGYKRIRVRVKDPDNNTYEVYSVVTNFP